MTTNDSALSYRDSGVNIDAGNTLVERIKPAIKKTHREGVMGGIGGFGALFELPLGRYKNPILVSGTDGVGTKLKLAGMLDCHDTVGIDLVAMCVNDIVVSGAEPLYFLDYFATGKLEVDQAEAVIKGISEGCYQAGCALTGGETAEMPGMYSGGDYDLAGFAVGIVDKDKMLSPDNVKPGHILLGLASSGVHSNGFSLIRKVIERSGQSLQSDFGDGTLGMTLLTPTRIYVKCILTLLRSISISAISHITGGGITENFPRVLPDHCGAEIDLSNWELPAIFQWIKDQGNVSEAEMLRTFNCGIGMIITVAPEDESNAMAVLAQMGQSAMRIGEVIETDAIERIQYAGQL